MSGNMQHIDQATYLRGFSPWESLFEFGPPALIADFPRTDELSKSNVKSNPNDHVGVQLLGILAGSLQEFQNYNTRRDNVIKSLQQDILNQIKMGDLIPFGFKEPRDISDLPIQIPGDLLFSGVLNWEKGELKIGAGLGKGIYLGQPQIIFPINRNSKNRKNRVLVI